MSINDIEIDGNGGIRIRCSKCRTINFIPHAEKPGAGR